MTATASRFTYPASYSPNTLNEQIAALRHAFAEISTTVDKMQTKRPLPEGAEAYFAIPRWQMFAPTYGEAVERVFRAIAKQWTFHNSCEELLGAKYLRQSNRSTLFFEKVATEQPDHDILVIPAQFGLRHCGRSVLQAHNAFVPNEFGLGVFAVAIMMLTHPERSAQIGTLCVDCPGDEVSPEADGDFSYAPSFDLYDGDLDLFFIRLESDASDAFGAVSGFVWP